LRVNPKKKELKKERKGLEKTSKKPSIGQRRGKRMMQKKGGGKGKRTEHRPVIEGENWGCGERDWVWKHKK